jgi:hypothetical protein
LNWAREKEYLLQPPFKKLFSPFSQIDNYAEYQNEIGISCPISLNLRLFIHFGWINATRKCNFTGQGEAFIYPYYRKVCKSNLFMQYPLFFSFVQVIIIGHMPVNAILSNSQYVSRGSISSEESVTSAPFAQKAN